MQNPSHQRDPDQDQSVVGDSAAVTVEFLRARLLAERSVSRAARQRADELAKRVVELEEQLKIVSLQRKKAEKATADVLAILENHGLSDFSEEIDSSSDQEINHLESKTGNNVLEEESSADSKIERNHGDDLSSSEIETSSLPGRSLSWKSGKDSPSAGGKKYIDVKKRSPFASPSFSSQRRSAGGKSCRRIRQREARSAVAEHTNGSAPAPQENGDAARAENFPASSISATEIQENSSENQNVNIVLDGSKDLEGRQRDALLGCHLCVHNSDREMGRALEHQAQLIGQYEEEEKAQREWEEKFRENNSSPISCEQGTTHSDITEERDETKADSAPYPVRSNDSTCFGSKSNGENVLITAQSSSTSKLSGHRPSPSLQPEVGYFQSGRKSSTNLVSLEGENASGRKAESLDLVTREVPDKLGSVLEALQHAKLSLNHKLKTSPWLNGGSHGKAIEFPPKDRPDVPVGCDALFKVPSAFYLENTSQNNNRSVSNSRLSLTNYYPNEDIARNSGSGLITSRFAETCPRFPSTKPNLGSSLDAGLPHPNNFSYSDLNINGGVRARLDAGVPFPSPYLNNGLSMDTSNVPSSYASPTYPLYTDMMFRMPYGGEHPFLSTDMNHVSIRPSYGGEQPFKSTDLNHVRNSFASPPYPLYRDPGLFMPSGGERLFSSTGTGVGRADLSFYNHFRADMYR